MAKQRPTTIYNIKAEAGADKGCTLIDTAKNALLRMGDYLKSGDDGLRRNYGILGLALDGIADEMRDLKFENAGYKEKLKAYEAEIATLKKLQGKNVVYGVCDEIVSTVGKAIIDKVNKHLNVRSKTESEATEMTKGYDLFAESTPTKFEAHLDNDRILRVEIVPYSITRNFRTKTDTIRALAKRVRIVDYGGTVINEIYNKAEAPTAVGNNNRNRGDAAAAGGAPGDEREESKIQ